MSEQRKPLPEPGDLWQAIAVGYCEWENGVWPDDDDIRQASPAAKHIASYAEAWMREQANRMAGALPKSWADDVRELERLREAAQATFDAAGNGDDALADALVALGLALAGEPA